MVDLRAAKPAVEKPRKGISIRGWILILTIGLLALGSIQAGISLATLRDLQGKTNQTLETAYQIRSLGQTFQNRFLSARQNEAQLIIQTQINSSQTDVFASAVQYDLDSARQNLDEIERLAKSSSDASLSSLTGEVSRLQPILDQYEAGFQGIVSSGTLEEQFGDKLLAREEIARNINQEIERINTKSSIGVNAAQRSINRINEQANLAIPGIWVLAVFLAILAAILTDHQIIPTIKNVRKAAQQAGAGVLDHQVEIRGATETADLARDFNNMSNQLRSILADKEQRLKQQAQQLDESARQLQFTAEFAREMTKTHTDLEELLNTSVQLIHDRLSFYHAGVFLLDEHGEYAVLRAATGEAGAEMLRQGYKLKAGSEGIVGYVAAAGRPRLSQDVNADAFHFKNPFLPDTRSEIALPLKIGQTIAGVLDIQSTQANAFQEEDAAFLLMLADQLAIAVDYDRLWIANQDHMRQMEQVYGQYGRESWERLGQARSVPGYHYDRKGIHPIQSPGGETQETGEGKPSPDGCFPLVVHGQAIGELEVWTDTPGGLTDIEKNTLKVIAERVCQVMDSARLYEETRVRAAREQTLSELTARFSQTLRFDLLLQSAVQELGRLPKVAEASIHIGLPEEASQPRELG